MRVAVTGGAGFIGSALIRQLERDGHQARSLDVVTNGTGSTVNVLNAEAVSAALDGVQVLYHLAGPVVETARKQPAIASLLQLAGTTNVLEAAVQRGVSRVILASSFYVYGGFQADAIVNEASAIDLIGLELFGGVKLMAERLVRQYGQSYELDWAIARFGSVYGYNECPTARGSNVIRSFLEMVSKREPIVVWGKGKRRNQYTLLDDVVSGLLAMLDGSDASREVWNLVSPEETSTGDLARFFGRRFAHPVVFDEDKPEGASMAYMSSRKAIDRLGWTPTPLSKGIEETVEAMTQAGALRI